METPVPAHGTTTGTGTEPTAAEAATLIAQLRTTHDTYAALVTPLGEEAMHRQPAPGEWNGVQVIAHLGDLDLFNRTERYNRVLNETTTEPPLLPAYDPDARIAAGNYTAMTVPEALAFFKTERDAVVLLLEGLRPHEWTRVGIHPTRGPESLLQMATTLAAHDQMHIGQMQAAAGAA